MQLHRISKPCSSTHLPCNQTLGCRHMQRPCHAGVAIFFEWPRAARCHHLLQVRYAPMTHLRGLQHACLRHQVLQHRTLLLATNLQAWLMQLKLHLASAQKEMKFPTVSEQHLLHGGLVPHLRRLWQWHLKHLVNLLALLLEILHLQESCRVQMVLTCRLALAGFVADHLVNLKVRQASAAPRLSVADTAIASVAPPLESP